jgi:hypothetical protein
MPNLKSIIKAHNSKILSTSGAETENNMCNCRRKGNCPLNGKCKTSSIVYSATVSRDDEHPPYKYIGLTEQQFKRRYYQHQQSFKHEAYRHSTELSNYIWDLKANNIEHTIKWSIEQAATSYSCSSKRCNLCLTEKLLIAMACKDPSISLNKRSELISKCRHENKFYLSNYKGIT